MFFNTFLTTLQIDIIGMVCYAVAFVFFIAAFLRIWPVWIKSRMILAKGLCIASGFLVICSVYLFAHIFVRYWLVELKPFVHVDVAFLVRPLYLIVGYSVWRILNHSNKEKDNGKDSRCRRVSDL